MIELNAAVCQCPSDNAAKGARRDIAAPRLFQAAPCFKEIGTKNSPFSSFLSIIIIIIKMIVRCLILAGESNYISGVAAIA